MTIPWNNWCAKNAPLMKRKIFKSQSLALFLLYLVSVPGSEAQQYYRNS